MSDDDDFNITMGIIVGAIFSGMFVWMIMNFISINEEPLDKILQYQIDCKVKEFYYMDSHRNFCDRIGVSPTGVN